MGLATGQMLQDRYRIVSLLGEGGMGAVYRAWDARLNIAVALKEMVPQPGLDRQTLTQLRQQFQQEAQIMARLTHPNLVRVGDFFQEKGNTYLVMDFVEGKSLAQHIEQKGALPEKQVLEWAGQLLDALAYCHSQGIIHRDVKPQNVIIRPDGRAVLVDFGLVKLWDPNDPRTKTAMRGMGTPEYAPPEQYEVKAGHTDARTDIYGLGATLYHTLTGKAPPTATMRIADPEQFLPLRLIAPQVSEQTEAALMKSLELARSRRWQSAAEMAQSLGLSIQAWGEEKVKVASPPSGRGGTRVIGTGAQAQPTRRRTGLPFWAWALGGLAALAMIGLALGVIVVMLRRSGGASANPTPTTMATASIVAPTRGKTNTPTSSPPPTNTATRPPISTPTRPPTDTPAPTDTPPPTPTPRPVTPTPVPVIPPELIGPSQGGTFKSPVTFQWRGTLSAGQTYQVTARHPGSDYTLQSDLLVTQTWTADLPGDKFGEWRWYVTVIRGGNAAATSPEWMFWFNPNNTPPPPTSATNTPAPPAP